MKSWRDRTGGKRLALHADDPHLIPTLAYDLPNTYKAHSYVQSHRRHGLEEREDVSESQISLEVDTIHIFVCFQTHVLVLLFSFEQN